MISFILAAAIFFANGVPIPPVHYQTGDCPGYIATYQPWGRTITNCADASIRDMIHELAHHLDHTRLNMSHAGLGAEEFAEAVTDYLLGVPNPMSEQAWDTVVGTLAA